MVKKLLGDAVREERLRRNLSQNSLAEQAKIGFYGLSLILKTILAIHSWKHFMPWQLTYIFP